MSSSRYIAAARQRRAEPQAKPVPQQRPPVTSIASQAAFQQQHQNNQRMQQLQPQMQPRGVPPQHMNRANIMNQMNQNNRMQQMQQQMPQQMQQQMQQQNHTENIDNTTVPSRLTVSDAIGLITLRLGKLEQYIIDHQNDNASISKTQDMNLPENSEIIDKSVLHNIINRLDSIEKKDYKVDNSLIQTIEKRLNNIEIENTNKMDTNIIENLEKRLNSIEKENNYLINEVNKLTQTLANFMNETEKRLTDFDYAFSEIEKNFIIPTEYDYFDEENKNYIDNENIHVDNNENIENEMVIDHNDSVIVQEVVQEVNDETNDKNETNNLKNIVEMELNSDMPIGY